MYNTTQIGIRELDHRTNDGIEVSLFWDSRTDRVFISVQDHRRDRSFDVDVEAEDALDAFHHPYAYAPLTRADSALAA